MGKVAGDGVVLAGQTGDSDSACLPFHRET